MPPATGTNGVAIGAGSLAARAPLTAYTAIGLAAPQNAFGEVSVGAAGAERQITNVAAGSASTDAVNVAQLAGVQAQIGAVAGNAVLYDSTTHNRVTLAGAGGTTIGNLAAGAVGAASTEAVNGSQLFATNTAITNGAIGPVRYSGAATPTVPNGGVVTNDVTLVGSAAAPVGVHNVAAGIVATGSTDAVNGGQLALVSNQLGGLATLAVQYDDATRSRVTLGGAGAAAVKLGNLAPGTLAAGSTEAVNGGQLVTLGQGLAASLGGMSSYDPATNSVRASIGVGGVQYGTVQSAFDAVNGAINGPAGIRYFHVLSTLPDATVTGTDSIAIGPQASATAAGSVALGTGAAALRGGTMGYTALGLIGTQNSVGEVSVGAAGAERQITNVAAGVAATDAANVGQVAGVAAQVTALANNAVQYDNAAKAMITLAGPGGTKITNLTAGAVSAGSSDAVNGSQLNATNAQVTTNTTAITNLGNQVANGGTGPVQYANATSPTRPNGGVKTNDLTLVGAAAAPVGLHNVGNGTIAAGSTEAVNGGQLYTTNQSVVAAQGTADAAVALGNNSVQYGPGRTSVTFDAGGAPTVLSNVAAGVSPTDAVNVGQLNAGMSSTLSSAKAYTDGRIAALNFDVSKVQRQGYAGSSAALAAAALPQPYEAGKGMIAIGGGTYGGQSAVAVGVAKAFNDGRTVMRLSGSYDSQGKVGASGGVGYQF